MRTRCEQLRERALSNGLAGSAGKVWRIHCRSCEACRTELFLMENLQRQAANDRRHLGQHDVAFLLRRAARERQVSASRLHRVRNWALRLACALLVCLTVIRLHQAGRDDTDGLLDGEDLTLLAQLPEGVVGNYTVPLAPAGAPHDLLGRDDGMRSHTPVPGGWPSHQIDLHIDRMRDRLEHRRDNLMELYERDFGEGFGDDVWDATWSSHWLPA